MDNEETINTLAMEFMGWVSETMGGGSFSMWTNNGKIIATRYTPETNHEGSWNPLRSEVDCAMVRDKLAELYPDRFSMASITYNGRHGWKARIGPRWCDNDGGYSCEFYGDNSFKEAVVALALKTIGVNLW